jgi:hypothetical protein
MSLNPSPRRLNPNTAKAMAQPGKIASQEEVDIKVWASLSILPQLAWGSLNDERGEDIGKDVFPDDPWIPSSDRLGRSDIITFPYGERGGPGQSRKDGNVKDPDGNHAVDHSGTKDRGHEDGAQNSRKPIEHIGDPHDRLIHPLLIKSGQEAEENPKTHANWDSDETNQDGIGRSLHHPAEGISSVLIGSQPMDPTGGLKPFGEIHPIWIVRGVTEAEKSSEKNSQDDGEPDDEIGIPE